MRRACSNLIVLAGAAMTLLPMTTSRGLGSSVLPAIAIMRPTCLPAMLMPMDRIASAASA